MIYYIIEMRVPWKLDRLGQWMLSNGESLSLRKKLLFIVVLWAVIFLTISVVVSGIHLRSHIVYYPEEAAPVELDHYDWNVHLNPNNETRRNCYMMHVEKGEEVTFLWETENYTGPYHIGRINVFYNTSWGESGKVRLVSPIRDSEGENQHWEGTKGFHKEGNIYYHYRLDMGDISIFDRRASVILEGENLYRTVQTDPPPLISFFFLPAVIFEPSIVNGGFFLSFYIYFSMFILLDTLLIFYSFRKHNETRAFLAALLFMLNPITAYSMFQDESIMVMVVILSMMLIIRNKDKFAYVLTGLGISMKIWTFFFIPAKFFNKDQSLKERLLYPALSSIIAVSSLLFFYLFYGEDSMWFMSFYGGTAEKKAVGGEAFLAVLSRTPILTVEGVHTPVILGFLVIIILFVLLVGYRKNWEVVILFTAVIAVFLAIYPKVHWEYYMILFPSLVYLAIKDTRFFIVFYGIVSLQIVPRVVREYESLQSAPFLYAAVVCSLITSLLLLWMVYLFYKGESIPTFKIDTG